MPELHYHLVDVFTDVQFGGNQLAVYLNPGNLSTEQMQKIAREMNLSETTFVFPPDNPDNTFKVRIFTPQMEMPMAGHPTVGTAYVLQREGLIPSEGLVKFEELVGVIPVTLQPRQDGTLISMQQPVPKFGNIFEDHTAVAELLSLSVDDLDDRYPVQAVSSAVPFLYIAVKTLDAMKKIRFRQDLWEKHFKSFEAPSMFVFTPEAETPQGTVHSRMFAPVMGISEDPATGAACGPLGAYLVKYGIVPAGKASAIISEQGFEMGRPSYIHIRVEGSPENITAVHVGGFTVYMGAGKLIL